MAARDLRTRQASSTLVALFIVLATGIVAVGVLSFRAYAGEARIEVERQLSAIAELKVSQLVQWRKERLGDGLTLFANPAFSALVRRTFEDPRDAEARARLQAWLERYPDSFPYDEVRLFDAQGEPRLTIPAGQPPVSAVTRALVPEVMRSGTVTFQDFYRNDHTGRVHLAVLVPILDGRDGASPLGMLALRIDPEIYLYPFIQAWPIPSPTAETLLVRREGADALFLNELRFWKGTALTQRRPLTSTTLPAAMAASGREGIVDGVDYRGEPVIAALRQVPGSPWLLVARIDRSELEGPVRSRLWLVVLLVGALVAGTGAGTGWIWRHQVLRFERHQLRAVQEKAWLQDVIARSLNEVYVFDPTTLHFRFVNAGALRNIGYSEAEMTSLTPLDIKPEFSVERFDALVQPLRAGECEVATFETVHRRKDGSEYPVEVHLQLVEVPDGKVFLAVINDITDRKRAEGRIGRLNRTYAVLSEINQAIVRINAPQELYERTCQIAVELGGFHLAWVGLLDEGTRRVEVAAHAGVSDGYVEHLDIVVDDESRGHGPTATALRTGQHAIVNDTESDPRMAPWREQALRRGYRASAAFPLCVGGTTRGTFNLYSSEPGFFDDEEIKLLDELALDISFALEFSEKEAQRTRAETLLRESEACYRELFEAHPIPMCIFDPWTLKVLAANPTAVRTYGWTGDDLVHLTLRDFWVPDELKQLEAHMAEVARTDASAHSAEIWHHRRKDGTVIEVEMNASPVTYEGRPARAFTAQDITERRRVEEQTRQSQKMEAIGQLAGGIAHDFNNLLQAMLSLAQVLRSRAESPDSVSTASEIEAHIRHGAGLTQQLLLFSRRQLSQRTRHDLGEVAIEASSMLRRLIPENIRLGFDLAPERLWCEGDGGQFQQVLMNLAVNARDAMPAGGTIFLRTGQQDGKVWVEIEDQGCGMTPEIQARIFEPFFTTKEAGHGTGLGLSVVHGIVEQHGGHIQLTSQPGAGSRFRVLLPAADPPAITPTSLPGADAEIPIGHGERILIVEDEAGAREGLAQIMGVLGYQATALGSGEEALALAPEPGFDLLLTDLMLPEINGTDLARELCGRWPRLKVILMSGYTADEAVRRGIEDGTMRFLQKPFDMARLAQELRAALEA